LLTSYPLKIQVDGEVAEFRVRGGAGYVPMTFTGLANASGYELIEIREGKRLAVDQSVHGNDFWQVNRDLERNAWAITYNVCLDTPGDAPQERTFVFGPSAGREP